MQIKHSCLIIVCELMCIGLVSQSYAAHLLAGTSEPELVFRMSIQVELLDALKKGEFVRVDTILGKVPIDTAGDHGETALWWQVNIGNFEAFDYLLRKGASPTRQVSNGPNILELCAMQEDQRFLRAVIKQGVNMNMISLHDRQTPIFAAILHRQYANVELMLEEGAYCDVADVMGTTPVLLAADGKAFDVVLLLLKRGANPTFKNRQGYDVWRSLSEANLRLDDPGYGGYMAAKKLVAAYLARAPSQRVRP